MFTEIVGKQFILGAVLVGEKSDDISFFGVVDHILFCHHYQCIRVGIRSALEVSHKSFYFEVELPL
jgi:hypothetical protein